MGTVYWRQCIRLFRASRLCIRAVSVNTIRSKANGVSAAFVRNHSSWNQNDSLAASCARNLVVQKPIARAFGSAQESSGALNGLQLSFCAKVAAVRRQYSASSALSRLAARKSSAHPNCTRAAAACCRLPVGLYRVGTRSKANLRVPFCALVDDSGRIFGPNAGSDRR